MKIKKGGGIPEGAPAGGGHTAEVGDWGIKKAVITVGRWTIGSETVPTETIVMRMRRDIMKAVVGATHPVM